MSDNNISRFRSATLYAAKGLSLLVTLAGVVLCIRQGSGFFVTADQRGQYLFSRGEFEDAAEAFADPYRQATAQYRAGNFEQAASLFGGLPTAEASLNQGNSLVMLGKYEEAVSAYDRALQLQPDWKQAADNREIARGRAERMKFEGGDMTGGQMGADDYTFDNNAGSSEQTETVEGNQEPNDEALRMIWLRQVQTTPSEFLKAKFSYQRAIASGAEDD